MALSLACGGSNTPASLAATGAATSVTSSPAPPATRVLATAQTDPPPARGIFDSGCEPEAGGPLLGGPVRVGHDPFCVHWGSTESEATYRIVLTYPVTGEVFGYEVPAAAGEFVFPEEAGRPMTEALGTPTPCSLRGEYQVNVYAGSQLIGGRGMGVSDEVCAGATRSSG